MNPNLKHLPDFTHTVVIDIIAELVLPEFSCGNSPAENYQVLLFSSGKETAMHYKIDSRRIHLGNCPVAHCRKTAGQHVHPSTRLVRKNKSLRIILRSSGWALGPLSPAKKE